MQPAPIAAGAIGTAIAIGKRPASGCKAANGIPDGTVSGEAITAGMLGVTAAAQRRFLRFAAGRHLRQHSEEPGSRKSSQQLVARLAVVEGTLQTCR